MSTLTTITTNAVVGVTDATTKATVRLAASASDITGPVIAGGLFDTGNDLLNQAKILIVGVASVVALIIFIIVAHARKWALGGVIQGIVIGGLIGFAVGGGGMVWFGNQVKDTVGS